MMWIKKFFAIIYDILTFLSWMLFYPIFLLCRVLLPALKFLFPINALSDESNHFLKSFLDLSFNEQRRECFLWFLCIFVLVCVILTFEYFFIKEEEYPNPLLIIGLWIVVGFVLMCFSTKNKKSS